MTWDRNTSNLRDVLAELYWDRGDTVRFLLDVSISPAYVSISDKMINTWTSIVEYAMHEHMLDELIAQAREALHGKKRILQRSKTANKTSDRGVGTTECWRGVICHDFDLYYGI